MLAKGDDFDEIHRNYPQITEADLTLFKAREELTAKKALSKWGKDMREKNVGNHDLGSRGYLGKERIWAKEGAQRKPDDPPNPYDKFKDPLACRFVRARYRVDKKNGELVTVEKVKDLEKNLLVRNLPA